MGRARNDIAAVAGLQTRGRLQDRFADAIGNTRGATRHGDLAKRSERISDLGFDMPGLEREAENLADTINQQTAAQRGRPNILVGVPHFTAQDVAPFASILLKNQVAALADPLPPLDASRILTSFVNLIVNAGTQREWDLTSNSSFDLKNLISWHAEMILEDGVSNTPALDISAEVNAIQVLYERLCEHFRIPEENRSLNLR